MVEPPRMVDVPALAAALAGSSPPAVLDVRWRLGGPPGSRDHAAGRPVTTGEAP